MMIMLMVSTPYSQFPTCFISFIMQDGVSDQYLATKMDCGTKSTSTRIDIVAPAPGRIWREPEALNRGNYLQANPANKVK